jgi:hypothetical protein
MSTIEVVPLPGGSAKLGIYTREHCPPHATCRDTAGQWVVRISFSFTDQTAVGLLSVIPTKRNPGVWWTYRQNNPLTQAEGACCLNNTAYGKWTVRGATYDPGAYQTRLQFTDGQTLLLPM